MEVGPREACQGVRIPRCAGVHSVRNVSARSVQPLDRQCPGFHMMESCVAIRIPCFTRHCFRAASPPYPSTAVDFRKAPDRPTKPVQADWSSSLGLVLHRAQRPARTPSSVSTSCRHTGVTAVVGTRSRIKSSVSPLPCPAMNPATAQWVPPPFPVTCRNVYLLPPSGALAKKPQKA